MSNGRAKSRVNELLNSNQQGDEKCDYRRGDASVKYFKTELADD